MDDGITEAVTIFTNLSLKLASTRFKSISAIFSRNSSNLRGSAVSLRIRPCFEKNVYRISMDPAGEKANENSTES